jgi:hypothetical protein
MALDLPDLDTFNHFRASHSSKSIYMTRAAIDSRVAVAQRAFSLALSMLRSRVLWAADIVVS